MRTQNFRVGDKVIAGGVDVGYRSGGIVDWVKIQLPPFGAVFHRLDGRVRLKRKYALEERCEEGGVSIPDNCFAAMSRVARAIFSRSPQR